MVDVSLPPLTNKTLLKEVLTWLSFPGTRTPKRLFAHLQLVDVDVPAWLYEESPLKSLETEPTKEYLSSLVSRIVLGEAQEAKAQLTVNDVTSLDLEITRPILDLLNVSWWLKEEYHSALARAHVLGRTSIA